MALLVCLPRRSTEGFTGTLSYCKRLEAGVQQQRLAGWAPPRASLSRSIASHHVTPVPSCRSRSFRICRGPLRLLLVEIRVQQQQFWGAGGTPDLPPPPPEVSPLSRNGGQQGSDIPLSLGMGRRLSLSPIPEKSPGSPPHRSRTIRAGLTVWLEPSCFPSLSPGEQRAGAFWAPWPLLPTSQMHRLRAGEDPPRFPQIKTVGRSVKSWSQKATRGVSPRV